ncbi:nucleotidyltransferase domain-containing protein [Methylomonas paludis]|uniref:Nucleotidyltransferase domain-containing protein n=1 Tax=Methylomonas paludis TaxID=1173101 RepID=A0A975MRH9_9GAMM|nr:nucleotidyltransferase domain-containing protein [Methylomonas paludis]QWF72206.1 nucleotidyltransferase domain-containing protein [Methylomonas paludis]
MPPELTITPKQYSLLLKLLQQFLPAVRVWAFGSRIKGCAQTTSDLDLAVFAKPSQKPQVFALQEALEESNLPFRVDLLIWDDIPENFKINIQAQFVELVADTSMPSS